MWKEMCAFQMPQLSLKEILLNFTYFTKILFDPKEEQLDIMGCISLLLFFP